MGRLTCGKSDFLKDCTSTLLFIICFSFVVFKGYECFQKFFNKPEVVSMSYQFSGKVSFPLITFCPQPENKYQSTNGKILVKIFELILYWFTKFLIAEPLPYNKIILKKCGLLQKNYILEGPWNADSEAEVEDFCKDPKLLHKKISPTLKSFQIKSMKVRTYNGRTTKMALFNKQSKWTEILDRERGTCYSLSFSDEKLKDGIKVGVVNFTHVKKYSSKKV